MVEKTNKLILAALLASAFAFGVAGINWDLPSGKRADRILAPQWDKAALFDNLVGGWEHIYKSSEGSTPLSAEADGKYSTRLNGRFNTDFKAALPEPELWNSYRSMLIRSRYPDEALPLSDLARMKPAELDFRPPSFLYGGAYLYPLGAYYFALSKVKIVEPLPLRSALERTDTLGGIYLAGRLLSAAAFAWVCLLVFIIVRRLEPGAAPYAAFAAALTLPVLAIHARYLTPHLWATVPALAAVYFAIISLPDLKLKPLLASGACLGLSAGSYWGASHSAIFILAVLLGGGKAVIRRQALKRIGLAVILAAIVFLATNPYVPFNWAEVMRDLHYSGAPLRAMPEIRPYLLLSKILPVTLGPAFALLFPAGCLWGLFSGRPLLRNLCAASLIFALPASATLSPEFPLGIRRFFPWALTGVMIGAIFLGRLTINLKPALRAAVFALALSPGLVMSAAYALSFVDAAGPRSTFYRMADKLDSMPGGATIGMMEFPQPASMPAFRLDRWRLRLADNATMPELPGKELPEFLLINFHQKAGVGNFLRDKYELEQGFYPRKLLGFTPDPFICAANPPLELYRLKRPGGG